MPHVDGVSHRWVSARGLRIHLAEAGPEDAEPILLLHGWPQHWYLWRRVIPALSQRYRLLMPDLRGLGWTEATPNGYEKENLARDQIALLDELGIERVKLMGHDWGGYTGFLMCLLAPARVERYIACNILHPWPKRSTGFLQAWRMWYQLPMVAPFIGPHLTRRRGVIKALLRRGANGVMSEAELEAFEAPYRRRESARATSKYYRSFQLHDLPLLMRGHWRAHRLTVPTLALFGTGDFAVPRSAIEGFEPYADDMRLELVPDAGHFVVDVAPEAVARHALEFFEAR